MDLLSKSERILSKINQFYRIDMNDSNDRIKYALQQLFQQWPDVLIAVNDASDDELFALNVSRAFLTKIFVIAVAKDSFNNDHLFTREIVRSGFDLLIKHIDLFKGKNTTITRRFLISNICLIMDSLATIVSLLYCTDMDLFNENDYELFIVMNEYVNQDFTHDNLTDGIIGFIWNISDNTSLVPILLKTNYPENILQWLKIREKKFREDKQDALIAILLNITRHDDGIDQLNSFNTLDIINQIEFHSSLEFQIMMIRVLLTDINHIQFESFEKLDTLVQLTIDAANSEDYRHEGSHVCEPLTVLTKLCYKDEIFRKVFREIKLNSLLNTRSMIELFTSLLIKFYPNLSYQNDPLKNLTCVLLFNLLWLISKHQEYCQIISDDEQLMNIINNAASNQKNFIDTFLPRTMKSVQQSAFEITKNLHQKIINISILIHTH